MTINFIFMTPMFSTKHVLPVVGILLVTTALYSGIFSADYVWDDKLLFVDSSLLRNSGQFVESITRQILPGSTYFRPAVLASFWAEFAVFGVHPFVSHSINLALHLLNTLMVYVLAVLLVSERGALLRERYFIPITAALLYALHPALVEPTVWVSARFDLLVTLFSLLGLVATLTLTGGVRAISTGLCFLFAASSKEMALVFPILWCGFLLVKEGVGKSGVSCLVFLLKKYWFDGLLLSAFGAIYLAFRIEYIPEVYAYDSTLDQMFVGMERIFLTMNTLYFYVKMAAFPFVDIGPLHPLFTNLYHHAIALGFVIASLVIAGVIYTLKRKVRHFIVLFVLFCVSLLPVLQIIPIQIGGNIGHERFMVLPLAMLALALAFVFADFITFLYREIGESGRRSALYAQVFLGFWLFLSAVTVRSTVPLWSNDVSLWSWAYEKHSDMAYAQAIFISSATRAGEYELVEELVERIESSDSSAGFDKNLVMALGFYYVKTQQYEKAKFRLHQATIWQQPPHLNYADPDAPGGFEDVNANAFPFSAYYRSVYNMLAEISLGERNFREALENTEISLFYQRDYPSSLLLKGMAYTGLKNYEEAVASLRLAKRYVSKSMEEQIEAGYFSFLDQYCELDELKSLLPCRDRTALWVQVSSPSN